MLDFNPCLLFMSYSYVNNSAIWTKNGYDECERFIYRKGDQTKQDFCNGREIQINFDTEYMHYSIVDAMILMLKHGLRTTNCSHFVFLSGSCLPLWNVDVFKKSLVNKCQLQPNFVQSRVLDSIEKFSQMSILTREVADTVSSAHIDMSVLHKKCLLDQELWGAPDEFYLPHSFRICGVKPSQYEVASITYHERIHGVCQYLPFEKFRELEGNSPFKFCRKIKDIES